MCNFNKVEHVQVDLGEGGDASVGWCQGLALGLTTGVGVLFMWGNYKNVD